MEKLTAWQALEKIKEAEAKARSIVESVKEKEVPSLLQAARDKAKARKEEIIQQAKKEAEKRKAAIIAQAEQEAAAIRQGAEEEAKKMEERAAANLAQAVKIITERILQELKGD